jgi:hypothetical protein
MSEIANDQQVCSTTIAPPGSSSEDLYAYDEATSSYSYIESPTPTITQYYTFDVSSNSYSPYDGPISFTPIGKYYAEYE